MTGKMPYLPSPGAVTRVLDKIIEAKTPDRFTVDFLGTRLGFKGGAARPIIPLLKRLRFLGDDGVPTELYKKFRTESGRGAAMAQGMRAAYDELFSRNEFAHDLDRSGLKDLVYEITGAEKGNTASESVVATFWNLKEYADFEGEDIFDGRSDGAIEASQIDVMHDVQPRDRGSASESRGRAFNLGYTININLPETTNVEVYNAIFEAIDRKLLK